MNRRNLLFPLLVAALLAGCAQVSHVPSGQVAVKDRMLVNPEQGWNQFEYTLTADRIPTWTQQGVTVDALKFYVGLKDGELIAPTPSEPKGVPPLPFKSAMQAADVVELFERLYSRGGSSFTLDKVVPAPFMGASGYRFEFASVRKLDDVQLRGVGWFTVRNGELWAITYTAPRLAFFPAGFGGAEAVARSARVKS